MIYQQIFERSAKGPVRTGLIGTGSYGRLLLSQSLNVPRVKITAICDRDPGAAMSACEKAGFPADEIRICDTREKTIKSVEARKIPVIEDAELLVDLPLDVVVECTGAAEAGARHADLAIRHGKHVVMVNKEADSVVGSILKYKAGRSGLVYTPADGDQHGLLMGLLSWAQTIGLDVVCGGKALARDFVFDTTTGKVTNGLGELKLEDNNRDILVPIPNGEVDAVIERRKEAFKNLPQIFDGDFCESVIAANSTGFGIDTPLFHAPAVRITEMPDVLCPRRDGGILQTQPVIELMSCLRRPDEAGMAGGVFIVYRLHNDHTRRFLQSKGMPCHHDGTYGVLYRPYHLLGVETPISVLCAGMLGIDTGASDVKPRMDVLVRSKRDLSAGYTVTFEHEQIDPDVAFLTAPAVPASDQNPIPLYLASGNRLKQDVAAGTILTRDMIEPPPGSRLWELREAQDRHFFSGAA